MEWNKHDLEVAGALRRLLKNRFMLRTKNEKWFQTIIDHRVDLQKHLKAFAAELEINESLGVTFIKGSENDVEEAIDYQLGRKKNLSNMSSLLLIQLRNVRLRFFTDPGKFESPMITLIEIREFLQNFNLAKIDSQFERLFRRSVDELLEMQILIETKPGSDLFEISPLCDLLLPADQIQEYSQKAQTFFGAKVESVNDMQVRINKDTEGVADA